MPPCYAAIRLRRMLPADVIEMPLDMMLNGDNRVGGEEQRGHINTIAVACCRYAADATTAALRPPADAATRYDTLRRGASAPAPCSDDATLGSYVVAYLMPVRYDTRCFTAQQKTTLCAARSHAI